LVQFGLLGDYDLFGRPGDEWRYYLVSGMSANMTSQPTFSEGGLFLPSTGGGTYAGFTFATPQKGAALAQVKGYVLVQEILQ